MLIHIVHLRASANIQHVIQTVLHISRTVCAVGIFECFESIINTGKIKIAPCLKNGICMIYDCRRERLNKTKNEVNMCVDTAVRYQATDSVPAAVVTFHRRVSIENVHSSSSQKCYCALRSMTFFF